MNPTFSIVIPTRNRPREVVAAVESVLAQDYGIFEIIVVDNSDFELQVPDIEASDRFKYDPDIIGRVRRIDCPTRLPMWDSWQLGASQAKGRYVIMMPDKCRMYTGALYRLLQLMQETSSFVTWSVDYRMKAPPRGWRQSKMHPMRETRVVTAESRLVDLLEWDLAPSKYPHGMNVCYPRFENHHTIYKPFCPDYEAGARLHSRHRHSVHTRMPVMWVDATAPIHTSNGAQFVRGWGADRDEFLSDCREVSKATGRTIPNPRYPCEWVAETCGVRPYGTNYEAALIRTEFARHKFGGKVDTDILTECSLRAYVRAFRQMAMRAVQLKVNGVV